MMVETRHGYHPDHESFGRFMLSEQARKPVVEAARDIARIARDLAIAEVGEGPFAESFEVDANTAPVIIGRNPRVGARIYNGQRHAAVVEFGRNAGGQRRGGHRVLRRAGAMVGESPFEPG